MKKSIGGYLGLELSDGQEFYSNAIALNSGRSALEYILKCNNYTKIYLPFFTCDAVLQPIIKLNLDYEFYEVNQNLEPIFDFKNLFPKEGFIYTNYFGLKSDYIQNNLQGHENIIIDNAQAFYAKPLSSLNTFYSPRKFFGIPDGGYAFSKKKSRIDLKASTSYDSMSHLIKQLDVSTEYGFLNYQRNENNIEKYSLQSMSNITKKLLKSVDYEGVIDKRNENFNFLAKELNQYNQLDIKSTKEAPLSYPLFLRFSVDKIREDLVKQKIYTPKFWSNVLDWLPRKDLLEAKLVENMLHLPIDQRYNHADMNYIAMSIKKNLERYE